MTMNSKIPYPLHWNKELSSPTSRGNGPPHLGVIKVNCYASFDAWLNIAWVATVLQDSYRSIIGGTNRRVITSSVTTAEALACIFGLQAW
ncbi:hypothetical protein V6N13_088667 [Hibiscus sabdariffa]